MTEEATNLMPVFTAEQATTLVEAFTRAYNIIGAPPSSAVLGSNIITNGTFDSGLGGWTFTGWSWSAGKAQHNSGNTNSLTQTIPVVNGTTYLILSTVGGTDPLAGVSNIYVNNVLCPGYNTIETTNASTNYTSYTATSSGSVTFEVRVTTDFVGTYDNIFMWPLTTNANSIINFKDPNEGIVASIFGDSTTRALGFGRDALAHNVDGTDNIGIGSNTLSQNLSGDESTAIGNNSLRNNTTGYSNTALGYNALRSNTGGYINTGIGHEALMTNLYGAYNTAIGVGALHENISGISNTAIGVNAGYTITGNYNVAIGSNAIGNATPNTGTHNNAMGIDCMRSITSGRYNQAVGYEAMWATTTGLGNDAFGHQALRENIAADYNAGFGYQALTALVSGTKNTAFGASAGNSQTSGNNNVNIGSFAGVTQTSANRNLTGANNTWIGTESGPGTTSQLTNSIAVGYRSQPTASNMAHWGNSSITVNQMWGDLLLDSLSLVTTITNLRKGSVGAGKDGGGATISTGKISGYFTCPFAGTISAWNIAVDTGTITIKVWKIATGTAVPTSANSINTSGISLSSNTYIRSTTLTDFTSTTVTAGDIFAFNIEAVSGVTQMTVQLEITKT